MSVVVTDRCRRRNATIEDMGSLRWRPAARYCDDGRRKLAFQSRCRGQGLYTCHRKQHGTLGVVTLGGCRMRPHAQTGSSASNNRSKTSATEKVISTLLSMSSVPYASYIPRPRTWLHDMLPEVKLLWIVGILFLVAKASSSSFRLAMTAMMAFVTMVSFPERLWKSQLLRVVGISLIVLVLTACGSDGVAPVLSGGRAPLSEIVPDSVTSPMYPSYRYTVLHLGIFSITKRSLALSVTLFSIMCMTLQAASICLVTTPPERMALAVKRAISPLALVGLPVHRLYIMLLLSFRFMSTVFEEMRNLVLALASRGVDWSQMGGLGTINVVLKTATTLFTRLFKKSDTIADAMMARGFVDPEHHAIYSEKEDTSPGGRILVNVLSIAGFFLCMYTSTVMI